MIGPTLLHMLHLGEATLPYPLRSMYVVNIMRHTTIQITTIVLTLNLKNRYLPYFA
jgi:hypothetical protein